MTNAKKLILAGCAALSAFALFAGNVCTWYGTAGDGQWGTAGNWDIKPQSGNGDTVILQNTGNSPVINNDMGTMAIAALQIASGSQALTLTGDMLQLDSVASGDASAYYDKAANAQITISCPLYLPTKDKQAYFLLVSSAYTHVSGNISGPGGLDYRGGNAGDIKRDWAETDLLKLSGDNTFEGTVNLRPRRSELASTNALGKAGKSVYLCQSATCQYLFSAPGLYDYKFSVSDQKGCLWFSADCQLAGFNFYSGSGSKLRFCADVPVQVDVLGAVSCQAPAATHKLDLSFPDGGHLHFRDSFVYPDVCIGVREADGDWEGRAVTGGRVYFHDENTMIATFLNKYGGVEFYHPNFLPEGYVPYYDYRRTAGVACYYLNGNDQTIDHLDTSSLTASYIADTGRFFETDAPAALTIKATAGGEANVSFQGPMSVIYDAQGDYRQAIYNRTIAMTGDLIVSNGTFALTGTTTMKNANEVVVAGGAFEIASTTAKSLQYVKRISVADGGTLKVATTVDPFAGSTAVDLEKGAKLDVGSAFQLTTMLSYDGEIVANDRYQKIGGSDPTATPVEWMTGDGVFTMNGTSAFWKSAVDGNWGDATKWAPAVPTSENAANLTAEGASYVVSVTAPETGFYKDIVVRNVGDDTATLRIASEFATSNATVVLDHGAKVEIPEGGSWNWWPKTPGGSVDEQARLTLRNGAEFKVDGGTFTGNAFSGSFAVGDGTDSVTSKVVVTSGLLDFLAATTASSKFVLNDGGALEVSGTGIARFRGPSGSIALRGNGGTIDVSDAGRIEIAGGNERWFGGDTTFRDDAVLALCGNRPKISITPNDGRTIDLRFEDHARIGSEAGVAVGDYFDGLTLNAGKAGATTRLHLDSDGIYNLGGEVYVGRAAGRGELHLSNGHVYISSTRGLAVGVCDHEATVATPIDCTGVLEVSGGVLEVSGGGYTEIDRLNGLTIGNGYCRKDGREGRFEGYAYITGGIVTNRGYRSIFGAGIGQAYGEIVQTGGRVALTGSGEYVVLGLAGGDGRYVISNGTFEASNEIALWVGGVSTNAIGHYMSHCPADRHDANGYLGVFGGSFTAASGSMTVGADGSGTIEVGETGSIAVRNLVLSNSVSRAAGTTTGLGFTFGPTGVGGISVSGALRIDPGTKLTVDASAYAGGAKGFVVLEAANRTGDFAEEDVTVIPPPDNRFKTSVKWRGNKLRVGLSEGLLMIIR